MAEENTGSTQQGNPQGGNNSSNSGPGLPPPDPGLSDYYKRDGESPNVVRK